MGHSWISASLDVAKVKTFEIIFILLSNRFSLILILKHYLMEMSGWIFSDFDWQVDSKPSSKRLFTSKFSNRKYLHKLYLKIFTTDWILDVVSCFSPQTKFELNTRMNNFYPKSSPLKPPRCSTRINQHKKPLCSTWHQKSFA